MRDEDIPFGEPHSWTSSSLIDRAANPPEPPTIGGLLYPAKRTLLSGETESLKTWLALILAKAELDAGYSVGWADLDAMGVDELLARLRALGVSDDDIHQRFLYYDPTERLVDHLLDDVCGEIAERQIRLFVIDAFNPMLSLHGLDPGSTPDIETFWREIATRITAAGAAPTLLDHVVKNVEGRGKYAYGSERKASGAIVHVGFRLIEPFSRGATGRTILATHKDRPGYLPRPTIGRLVLISDGSAVTYELEEDHSRQGDKFRPTVLMERVSIRLEGQSEARSQTWVEENVKGKVGPLRTALEELVEEGFVLREDTSRGHGFTSIRPFRESDDEPDPVPTPSPEFSPRPDPVPTPSPRLLSTPVIPGYERDSTPSPTPSPSRPTGSESPHPVPPSPSLGGDGDGVGSNPLLDESPRWPFTARCPVCEMDKGARLAAGVTYLACGHFLVSEDEGLPF